MDQNFLNNYFKYHWKPSLSAHNFSSYAAIAEKINDDEYLLDVGCGYNPFKPLVKNVVGIDPAFDQADYQVTIEEFTTDQRFDIATCLGSINFGSKETIARQIDKMVMLLKPRARVYWRLNPGRKDHSNELCQQIEFFPWTFETLKEFADQHGFEQVNCNKETNGQVIRFYAEWKR